MMLAASAKLGEHIAAITDLDQEVGSVSRGKVPKDVASVAAMRKTDGAAITEDDLSVTAGWGRISKNGITGGRGKIIVWADGKAVETADENEIKAASGDIGLDIYINDAVYFSAVPRDVWQYSVAGYQVLKKWLSYREQVVLRRPLDVDEAREFTEIARRIAALLQMTERLNDNYRQVKAANAPWPSP